jgi:hypothetical protein
LIPLQYGIVGGFWFAAAMAMHLFLFAIVACEIRIKAPGAKTFLQVIKHAQYLMTLINQRPPMQVIYRRHGVGAHVVTMIITLFVSVVFSGISMVEGTRIISALTDGIQYFKSRNILSNCTK